MPLGTVSVLSAGCHARPTRASALVSSRSDRRWTGQRALSTGTAVFFGLLLHLARPVAAAEEPSDEAATELFADKPDVTRFIIGFEQAAASAAESERKYFIDFTIDIGFGRKVTWPLGHYGPRFRTWGTVRLTSVPQQVNVPVGEFATQFDERVANIKVNDLVQAGELLSGIEVIVSTWPGYWSTKLERGGVSLSVIAGGGVITPLDPQSSLRVFELTDESRQKLQIDASKNFVAFVSKDRDRFFRQWYAGLRLRTHYRPSRQQRPNSTLDVAYGQDEAITGGRLTRSVLRIEGFYPMPWGTGFIYLYGTALVRPGPVREKEPLLLRPAPPGIVVPAADVEVRTIPQVDKDFYRLGIGIDVVRLYEQFKNRHP